MSTSDHGRDPITMSSLMSDPDPIPVVEYRFECGDVPWHVRRILVEETIGRPYRCHLDLVTDDTDLLIEELVGANATLEMNRGGKTRLVKGYVEEIEHLGVVSRRSRVRVQVAPVLAWLDRASTSRIFQAKTVPEIIKEVVEPVLAARARTFDTSALDKRGFRPRDYCVQFHESDLDFLHRLLEEEGLTYIFDHASADWEAIVFTATNEDFVTFEGLDGLREVPLTRGEAASSTESVSSFDWTRRARAPRAHQRDWDWSATPPELYDATRENAAADDTAIDVLPAVEVYESNDHRLLDHAVEQRAERKQQSYAVRDTSGVGRSNVTGLSPGWIFELGHDDFAGHYLVTRVTHEGDAPQADVIGNALRAETHYVNRFHCIPADTPYRPARTTRRPTIPGPQTAVVTGADGEEIYTDEHGRIKVRMHWDRAENSPEDASCWIRVAQMWGGAGWGSVFLPRVGMEVIVTFLNGDPDRPVVTGCVYNGGNRPPYPLPDEKTKSTIKSSSCPGGQGYNELTFEDAAGSEQIIVHAQKDLRATIRGDHSTSVGGSQRRCIGRDQSNTVENDQAETVGGNVTVQVKGARSQTITGKETLVLENARETSIAHAEVHQVTQRLTESFDGGRTTAVTGDDTEVVSTGNKTVTVSDGSLTASARTQIELKQTEAHKLLLQDNAELSTAGDFTVTNRKVTVESDGGALRLTGQDQISLVCGAASLTLRKDGTIDIKAAKKTVMGTPGGSLCAEPSGVTISGPKIKSAAIGLHEVLGSLVKIN